MSDFDAVAALTASLQGKGEPQADDADDDDGPEDEEDDAARNADDEEADESPDDEEETEETAEDDEPSKDATPAAVTDDTVVTVTVDGQETEFTVGNLKRLAGQEASLTRKSQEADLVGGRAAAALQGAIESILEDLEPYKGTDWLLESRRMDPEEFEWHRETYNRLTSRYQKVIGAAKDFESTMSTKRDTARTEAAKAARTELGAEWTDALDDEVRKFAVSRGLPESEVAGITSPVVLRIIQDALLHTKAATATAQKVKSAPKAVRKGSGREPLAPSPAKSQRAFAKKAATGAVSDDDAIAALVGRWGV